ncbi:MAG: HNH endonuclease signature motif containing protein, partial [Atopobium minutum]|nr:HNH endonuclease signature motif containing protein [Atopobium minutum]
MPRKPKKPCSYPGCPNLTDGRFCEEHQKKYNRDYEKYNRDKNAKRKYGHVWKRIRDRYIAAHPLCEECLKEGHYTKATEVHHRTPLSWGGTHREDNLEALCHECHSRITALMGDRWRN